MSLSKNIPKSKEHQHKEELKSTNGENRQLTSNVSNPKFKSSKSPNQKIQPKTNCISKDTQRLKTKGCSTMNQSNGEQK